MPVLTDAEIHSLVEGCNQNPHGLLGMHPLGSKPGIVVRALIPDAAAIRIEPVHDKTKPIIELKKIHTAGLFEGYSHNTSEVYAYDLVITYQDGRIYRTRDPYSFLPTISDFDLYLFNAGDARRIYRHLGAHLRIIDGVPGTSFAVWAPCAKRVSVIGTFNNWHGRVHQMRMLGASGVWEIFIPGVKQGDLYKFELVDPQGNLRIKTDPYGFFFEIPPKNASIVWDMSSFCWNDDKWLEKRAHTQWLSQPISIYEVHLGSWRKKSPVESYSYTELAPMLIDYLRKTGFTHVEFLPVMEHAYYPSWGYQVTGFYAPTSRYGTPNQFMALINDLHQAGFGVIIDWVPAHFPADEWALAHFDGTAVYEHEDPRLGKHQDWNTLIFNYGRYEVLNFLIANALFWCEQYHVDGLRVDAVASMLYLDYSRKPGEWIPNKYGGKENLEAIAFLQKFNHLVHTEYPGILTIAEESTAWPMVTRPPYLGGLGFTLKWDLGWMHDTLRYFSRDPIYRKYHHNDLTFAMMYRYTENFVLPLSHDEVVHGKRSLIGRMPGDQWQQFANLRALFVYQWTFPGKKLLFMGSEFAQYREWDVNGQIDWHLLESPHHKGVQKLITDLNALYRQEPAFFEAEHEPAGFSWIDCTDSLHSVIAYLRHTTSKSRFALVVLNLTPVPRFNYRIGLPLGGKWIEVLNSDSDLYGGSNLGNFGAVTAEPTPWHNQPYSAEFTLPPLAGLIFTPESQRQEPHSTTSDPVPKHAPFNCPR